MFTVNFSIAGCDETCFHTLDKIRTLISNGEAFALYYGRSRKLNNNFAVVRILAIGGTVPNAFFIVKKNDENRNSIKNFNFAVGTTKVEMEFNIISNKLIFTFSPDTEEVENYLKSVWI